EKFIEITSLWNPKVDSVNTGSSDNDKKELMVKSSPLQQPDNQENKPEAKSFLYNLFNKKPAYKQSTLY
ncbi:MAG TPA: hypothetical protein VGK38_02210, partial [Prolixibacteraceae bacterium]